MALDDKTQKCKALVATYCKWGHCPRCGQKMPPCAFYKTQATYDAQKEKAIRQGRPFRDDAVDPRQYGDGYELSLL